MALFASASAAGALPLVTSNGTRAITRYSAEPNAPASDYVPFDLRPAPPVSFVDSPLTFRFNVVDNLLAMQFGTPAQRALAQNVIDGFVEAGDIWRRYFVDPITVDIDIDYGPIGNGVLGGTSPGAILVSYQDTRIALGADTKSADDASAVAHLQPARSLQFITNDTSFDNSPNRSPRTRDNDSGFDLGNVAAANNEFLGLISANAKAIGIPLPAAPDANITFTDYSDYAPPVPTNLSWDFDRSNGISPDAIDFVGVAIHEIGHAMGFISGVDAVDYFGSPNGPGGPLDLDPYAVYGALDLFRFSRDSRNQPNQPAGGLLDLAYHSSSSRDNPYFSIDGGATNLGAFSTGAFNGDGGQASHWKQGQNLGIMNPSISTGVLAHVSALDVRALDVIGWDLRVPEPAGLAPVMIGLAGLCGCRARGSMRA